MPIDSETIKILINGGAVSLALVSFYILFTSLNNHKKQDNAMSSILKNLLKDSQDNTIRFTSIINDNQHDLLRIIGETNKVTQENIVAIKELISSIDKNNILWNQKKQ